MDVQDKLARSRIRGRRRAPRVLLGALFATAGCFACGPGADSGSSANRYPDGSGGRNAPEQIGKPHLVLVSFDGFRHDYLDRFDTPNFDRVQSAGARADALKPVFPSLTFPNHYTIATGLYPENHGLVGNSFLDPTTDDRFNFRDAEVASDGRWYGGEPIWITAERQGMVAASFFFVGTEADISGLHPTHWRPFDAGVRNEVRVSTALGWLGEDPQTRPHLITLYFSDVDRAGHQNGPDDHRSLADAVEGADALLGRLLDGIAGLPHAEEVYVVVVSDHGMARLRPDGHLVLDELADMSGVRMTAGGPYATLFVDGGDRRIDELRGQLEQALPTVGVHRRDDAPEHLHVRSNARFGDLVLVPDVGYTVGRRRNGGSEDPGMHGWDPADPTMHGIFLAMGPGIPAGTRLATFESVHVYPFLARALGLEPAKRLDGDPAVLSVLAP